MIIFVILLIFTVPSQCDDSNETTTDDGYETTEADATITVTDSTTANESQQRIGRSDSIECLMTLAAPDVPFAERPFVYTDAMGIMIAIYKCTSGHTLRGKSQISRLGDCQWEEQPKCESTGKYTGRTGSETVVGDDMFNCDRDPPVVTGAAVTIVEPQYSPVADVKIAVYTCNANRTQIGSNNTVGCRRLWDKPAVTCAGSQLVSPCRNSTLINVTNVCTKAVRYRYSLTTKRCSAIVACQDTPIGTSRNVFLTIDECSSNCQSETLKKSAGTKGASCISGVDESHSSCLPNDESRLRSIVSFDVHNVLAAHNVWRQYARPPVDPLQWNDNLAVTAERRAAQCSPVTEIDLLQRRVPGFGDIGQNLCIFPKTKAPDNTTIIPTWVQCVSQQWGVQLSNWTNRDSDDSDDKKDSYKYYGQLVSEDARFVGCGMAECQYRFIMICNYGAPADNAVVGSENSEDFYAQ